MHIIINVAQTLNGYIAGPMGERLYISNNEDISRVNSLRKSVDGILVGANTIIHDDPNLLPKEVSKDSFPTRIVLDGNFRAPLSSKVFDGRAKTLLFTYKPVNLPSGSEAVVVNPGNGEMKQIIENLQIHGLQKILVEGGRETIIQFVKSGLVDEFYVFVGNLVARDGGIKLFSGNERESDLIKSSERLGDGLLLTINSEIAFSMMSK